MKRITIKKVRYANHKAGSFIILIDDVIQGYGKDMCIPFEFKNLNYAKATAFSLALSVQDNHGVNVYLEISQ